MPNPTGITQLLVWKDVLIALTGTNEIWLLRGLGLWPPDTPAERLTWVRIEAQASSEPATF